jgi:hypothetical protein
MAATKTQSEKLKTANQTEESFQSTFLQSSPTTHFDDIL